jgi:hypothetical protein
MATTWFVMVDKNSRGGNFNAQFAGGTAAHGDLEHMWFACSEFGFEHTFASLTLTSDSVSR